MVKIRKAYLLIFTLAVIAILFRPFLAYQIAESRHLEQDPVAKNNLLQRLIKKKDDHRGQTDEYLAVIQQADKRLPQRFCTTPKKKPNTLAVRPLALAIQPETHSKFGTALHYYALYAQFRV